MKQIIQDLKSGKTILAEIPAPVVQAGHVLIKTRASLVSLGTEKMLVEFGKSSYIQKARQQPEKVKQVIDKIKTVGLIPTVEAVYRKLNEPLPMGYSSAGDVIAVGERVKEFSVGQRVISNGPHAEVVSVPENLVALIPDDVSYEEASFTVVGAIGLQGIRLINPTFGETVVVIGLGLIGLITAQLLKANGCNVIGIDLDDHKIDLAIKLGIYSINSNGHDEVKEVLNRTNGIGADAVIITASAKSNDIISSAAHMSRKKGRIVLIGVVGLDLHRQDFYEKELTFQVSCSYGPGRYDHLYEQKGYDYPVSYVRWTEKRNFQAFLNALNQGAVNVQPLITERVDLNDFEKIYSNLSGSKSIASVLLYSNDTIQSPNHIRLDQKAYDPRNVVIGIIGAGNFTGAAVLPALKKANAHIKFIASLGGLSGTLLAKKFSISNSTTDYKILLADPDINLVLITTRHDLHAQMVVESLKSGKHVFVEKPLALNADELQQILEAYHNNPCTLTVGFNRRFAPLAVKMKELIADSTVPINIVATMNAGALPDNAWTQDMSIGGGRIIGEACHLMDLCIYLSGSKIKSVCMNAMGTHPDINTDNASILLKHENGSSSTIHYFANGSKSYSKERIELYSQGRTLVMDNWKRLQGYGFKGFSSEKLIQNKGHVQLFKTLLDKLNKGSNGIIPMDELVNTTLASFAAVESIKAKSWIDIDPVLS